MDPAALPEVECVAAELLREQVRAVAPEVAACSAGRPAPAGTWAAFDLHADGTVWPDLRLSDPEVDVCAARALAKMRFPPGCEVRVSWPPRLGDLGPDASARTPFPDGGWVELLAVGAGRDGVRPTRLVRYGPGGERRTGPIAAERWVAWDAIRLAAAVLPLPPDAVRVEVCTGGRRPCAPETVELVAGTDLAR